MKKIITKPRNCDCCNSNDLEEIWTYSFQSRTVNDIFLWEVSNVVCRYCGFAFVSPAPTEEILTEYYGDSYSKFGQQQLDFSIEKRLTIFKRFLGQVNGKKYVEIGSNYCPDFEHELAKYFDTIETVELNQSCDSTYNSIQELPGLKGDIVASYFVLEHVPNPRNFFLSCYQILNDSGFLIIEVPNLYLYPKDPSGLALPEHVNHFSPNSLIYLAQICGLEVVDISQAYCSRSFGFVAVFQKSKTQTGSSSLSPHPQEFIFARSCMYEGADIIQKFRDKFKRVREQIDLLANNNKTVVIWAANKVCCMLLENYQLPKSAIIVDSDPRKSTYFHPLIVYQPQQVLEQIASADLLVINSKRHSDSIQAWIKKHTNRHFSEENLAILDYHFIGD